jgi:hypothetical protein
VELFTSEGCSSCPPADRALERLEHSQPVTDALIVPLSLHVDYWNRLGWADPYSSAAFSERQERYSDAFGGNRVYTPQMIVDGSTEFVGDESRAIKAVAEALKKSKAPVTLTVSPRCASSAEVKVSVGQLPEPIKKDPVEVYVAITESGLVNDVKRGENAGRSLRHTAVVRQLRSLGEVTANASDRFVATTHVSTDKSWNLKTLKAVAFLQQMNGRRIVGAAVQPLCAVP